MMQWVFIVLGLSCMLGAVALGGPAAVFFDLPSLFIVVVVGFAFSVAAHGMGGMVAALAAGFRSSALQDEDTEFCAICLQTLRSSLCAAGAAGFLIGLVKMLANMSDPSAIGPAMAVACLTLFYALVFAELIIAPMVARLRLRSELSANESNVVASELNA